MAQCEAKAKDLIGLRLISGGFRQSVDRGRFLFNFNNDYTLILTMQGKVTLLKLTNFFLHLNYYASLVLCQISVCAKVSFAIMYFQWQKW